MKTDDILGFLGLNVAMGIVGLPASIQVYCNFSISPFCKKHAVAVVTIDSGKFVLSSKLSKNNRLKPTF